MARRADGDEALIHIPAPLKSMADKEGPKSRAPRPDTTPDDYATTPRGVPLSALDHSFVLQSIMEVQKSIGQLNANVTTLIEQSRDHSRKIEDACKDIHAAKKVLYALGAVFTALGGIGVFFLNKIWDAVLPLIKANLK